MTRQLRIALAAAAILIAAAIAVAVPWAGRAGSSTTPPRSRALGPVDPGRRLDASLVLRLPHRGALERFLAGDSRKLLSPRQFGDRFGLSPARIAEMTKVLRAHGLSVTAAYPQRTALEIAGTAAAFEQAFGARLINRIDAHGRRWFAPATQPRVPAWLGGSVDGVIDLDTRPVLVPADVPAAGLSPAILGRAYDYAPLRASGLNGSGQTIAVMSYDSFHPSDLSRYISMFGIQGPAIQRLLIDGGTQPGQMQQEVDLDLETIHGIAPGAQVLDYEAPNGVGDADVINRIVADHRAQIISDSWGMCDLLVPPAAREATENALAAAVAAGITVFVAAGDNGGYDCQSANLDDQRPSVDWPAASDNVVAVGGTRLAVRADGSYLAEYGWEDPLQDAGGGGGLASVTPRPSWQQGPGVDTSASDGHRQVPDVAGPADPASGMTVITGGQVTPIGGTSAAAPFWASTFALMREYAERHGVSRIGFVAPLLYRLAASPATANAFHEPVSGGNRLFSVTSKWNFVSGLGSPDVAVMARDLVALLRQH